MVGTAEAVCVAPLRGVTIVEFGARGLAGALTARLLADQGAAVIRIERPGPSAADSPLARYLNRGKAVRRIDLTSTNGRAEATALLRNADVVIENFRPGNMERLGFGPEACADGNPGLIYLRLPGFAARDVARRDAAAWEGVLGSACGLFTDVNILRRVLCLPPAYTALPHASVYGAVHGALAVTLALYARRSTGRGDVIEVPLAAAGVSAMGSAVLRITPQPSRYDLPEWPRAVSRLAIPIVRPLIERLPQSWQQRLETMGDAAVPALMSSYRCADGRLIYVFAVDHGRIPRALLEELGLWKGLHAQGLVCTDPYAPGATSARNNLADSTRLSRRWQARLRTALAETLARQPAATWETRLAAAGIPCSVQRDTREWMSLPPLLEAGNVERSDDGGIRPGPAVWLADQTKSEPAVLAHAVPKTHAGPRLSGHLVLDLTSMVAGPVCGRTLAEYGATVIKLDSPHPYHGPRLTCWYGVDVNQGKRSILLDLAQPQGRELLDRLLRRADVLLHNMSDDAAARLHLGQAELRAAYPRLVVVRIGAYRGPRPGAFAARKGYDPVLQAATGIMRRYGSDTRPVHHGIASCIDYLTGYLAAWGAALALLQRSQRDGRGCEANTSLAQAAQLIQLPFAIIGKESAPCGEPTGQWAWGEDALHRLYRARDGWVFLAAPGSARDRICNVLGIAAPRVPDQELASRIARAIRRRKIRALADELADRNTAVVAVESLERLPATPADEAGTPLPDRETVRAVLSRGPDGEAIRTLAPTYARAPNAPLLQLAPAPRLGADTRDILTEIGLGHTEIERLLRDGVASEGLSARLLPD